MLTLEKSDSLSPLRGAGVAGVCGAAPHSGRPTSAQRERPHQAAPRALTGSRGGGSRTLSQAPAGRCGPQAESPQVLRPPPLKKCVAPWQIVSTLLYSFLSLCSIKKIMIVATTPLRGSQPRHWLRSPSAAVPAGFGRGLLHCERAQSPDELSHLGIVISGSL